MAIRCAHENCSEIGVFTRLTSSYCIVGIGTNENFFSVFESEIGNHVCMVHSTIGNTKLVGSLTVGNRHGLLVPSITTDIELQHLRNSLPDGVVIRRVEERLSALGNCIATNDYVALAHTGIDKETEEIVNDVLGVDVYRATVAGESLVGSYSLFTNHGGIVHVMTPKADMEELSNILEIPIAAGTVNRGSDLISAGLLANDFSAFCGMDTTATEMAVIEKVLRISNVPSKGISMDGSAVITDLRLRSAMIDALI